MASKKIASIRVVRPGSAPDVDSDFATYCRDDVLEHCEQLYGRGSLANIITFSTLAAKGSFKTMCTIYNIPFSQANKIAALVPPPIEGIDCTIADIFNPDSNRYSEGADFRSATAGEYWEKIIEGAKYIEGKNKATSVHPCGVIISSKPLSETIPLQVRQDDGRIVTQWTYGDCESLGLIKFDFLGLDTVDIIQHAVENIIKAGKTPPNMVSIIHGPMNDKKTFEMIGRGETIGIFQLAGEGVQDLLKRMKPTELEDITATTALYRPGPMGMLSHIKYADRKNGREKVGFPVHPEFKDSPLETILAKTYNLIVFQESVLQIANQIAGMTLQEGDDLRKAMGKKLVKKMAAIKPRFISGGMGNGYSQEAMNALWNNIAEFARYGFVRAHSAAYSINAYQAAYLKANYPTEFMAALISQNIGVKDKVLTFLQESRRMKLKVGSADINTSDVTVAPSQSGQSQFDIVYGLSGVNAVSPSVAQIIINERNNHGLYQSVQDLLHRCSPLGVSNKKVYENIALAGGFDSMGISRRAIVENLPSMLNESKMKAEKGDSLFDLFDDADSQSVKSVDFSLIDEYPHVEKLKKEASVIGLYLTSHPLAHIGTMGTGQHTKINKLMASSDYTSTRVLGSITEIKVKRMRRGGKSIMVSLDDGTGYINCFINKEVVKGLDKNTAQAKIRAMYIAGAKDVPQDIRETALDSNFTAMEDLEIGSVYSAEIKFRPGTGDSPYNARVNSLTKVELADDGSLPVRLRLKKPSSKEQSHQQLTAIKDIALKNKGTTPILVAYLNLDAEGSSSEELCQDAIDAMLDDSIDVNLIVKQKTDKTTLMGENTEGEQSKKSSSTPDVRSWPPPKQDRGFLTSPSELSPNQLTYRKLKFNVKKSQKLSHDLEAILGIENFDFGFFDANILND
jgi:DNA polymerase-3 subunit alpha